MAQFVLANCGLFVHSLDLSAETETGFNAVGLAVGAEAVDATRFVNSGNNARIFRPGLRTAALEAEGYFSDTGDVDSALFGAFTAQANGEQGVAVTALPEARAIGDPAYLMRASMGQFSPFGGGEQGGMLKWRASFAHKAIDQEATNPDLLWLAGAVRGELAFDITAGGVQDGTALQLGAVGATQRIYCTIHVFAATTAATVQIQSDDAEGFPSATAQINEAGLGVGSYTFSAAGAVTDDWWRVSIQAGTGLTMAVGLGIL